MIMAEQYPHFWMLEQATELFSGVFEIKHQEAGQAGQNDTS